MPVSEADPVDGVLDGLDSGIVVLDADARVLHWNSWMADASGIAAAAAAGRSLPSLFGETTGRRLVAAVGEALESGASSVLSHALHPALLPLRTASGQMLIHNVTVRPVDGGRAVLQVSDVTDVAHRERVLRDRLNARYNAVVDSAADAILTLDAEGRIQIANRAAAREFGYAAEELIGRPATLLFRDQPAWTEAWRQLAAGGRILPIQLVAWRRNGTPSHVEVSAAHWLSGSMVFVTAILRDVNERRAAEEALRSLNLTLERRVAERTADRDRMWRLSTDVMLVAQLDGTINAVNPAWTGITGWPETSLVGANLRDFIGTADRDRLTTELGELARDPSPRMFELRLDTLDRGMRWIEWSAVASDGLLQAVGRDVTAEKTAAEALRQAEDALRHSQKMEAIGQLTGGIAHDFNNLLGGIVGALEVIKTRVAQGRTTEVDRFIGGAISSAERAAALTHRLLAFSRRQPLDPRPVDANALVAGMEDLLRRTIEASIALELALGEDAGWIRCDPGQLENALLNLCINARDAMPDGGRLRIETSQVRIDGRGVAGPDVVPGPYVAIAVSDTGMGMPPDVVARAFDPFFTTKPIGKGTGLGLSMVYGFVRQSGGQVEITSEPGRGTTVRLLLPQHQGAARDEAEEMPAVEAPRAEAGQTVLVVEDEFVIRSVVIEVLKDLGYRALEASDGVSALEILAAGRRIDLLVTDVGLPGLNGRQLADQARERRPDLKVLFITGYAASAAGPEGFLDRGMAMITKPFAIEALARKIHEMIEGEGR